MNKNQYMSKERVVLFVVSLVNLIVVAIFYNSEDKTWVIISNLTLTAAALYFLIRHTLRKD